ncbi:RNA 2'-phosphotransferase [Aestuariispira insulae]|uniref:Probable RNA 2'-phosphotransferase n=1 Tax=Aestuariispira insulae TaxID=1461337 RepID=A0A3D9HXA7_9PROT|nr:RNA 2'-phosphotransferase [Aestuariispira insulae]RED54050.1 putative RNA 2'-phosphotransferase [Aestuariispira insulae]
MVSDHVRVSKFLSFILRHKPGEIGLELDAEGWAVVDELIEKATIPLSRALIEEVVATNEKKRFALSEDGQLIRANQSHSIQVNLGLLPTEPPETLFHGTAERFLETILKEGLKPMSRQYVHLSADAETARMVGSRHGKPIILALPALEMHQTGHQFFLAKNGVWLSGLIGPSHLNRL